MQTNNRTGIQKPKWLKTQLPTGQSYLEVKQTVHTHKLHTICESGRCPNLGECWGAGTATFMILGDICTRSCRFCSVKTGRPDVVDFLEPARVARSIELMKLKHCVITSVDRDDLDDGGADIWAKTIKAIQTRTPEVTIETLIPDFQAREDQIQRIIDAAPDIVSHNIETVRRLTREVRRQAQYDRSLKVLRILKDAGMVVKSGIMVGLGETNDEILETLRDLYDSGCEIVTIGQYLQPSKDHLPVHRYAHPDEFEFFKTEGLKMGFKVLESGPLVRSSYHAEKHLFKKKIKMTDL